MCKRHLTLPYASKVLGVKIKPSTEALTITRNGHIISVTPVTLNSLTTSGNPVLRCRLSITGA